MTLEQLVLEENAELRQALADLVIHAEAQSTAEVTPEMIAAAVRAMAEESQRGAPATVIDVRTRRADLARVAVAAALAVRPLSASDGAVARARNLIVKLIVRDRGDVVRSPPAERFAEQCAHRFLGRH